MVVNYYIKLFHERADKHNCILMSFLILVAEAFSKYLVKPITTVSTGYWRRFLLVKFSFVKIPGDIYKDYVQNNKYSSKT